MVRITCWLGKTKPCIWKTTRSSATAVKSIVNLDFGVCLVIVLLGRHSYLVLLSFLAKYWKVEVESTCRGRQNREADSATLDSPETTESPSPR